MKRSPTIDPKLACIALALAGMLGAVIPASSGPLTIAPEPLGAPAGLVLPNIMFILDDSGSMDSDFLPDSVNDSNDLPGSASDTTFTTAACADNGDSSSGGETFGTINGPADACVIGDPPYSSPDYNEIYYNPGISYMPGVNIPNAVTGVQTDMLSQNATNTANWTQVKRNPYLVATVDNLATAYKDRVWCTNQADAASSGLCRQNTAYQYPDAVFPYGQTTGGAVKTVNGSPYYYRMQSAQYCTTVAPITCVSGSSVNPSLHTQLAPEFCTDAALTDCAAGPAVTAAHTFSGPRWCADAGTLTNCRKKKGAVTVQALSTTPPTGGVLIGTAAVPPALSNYRQFFIYPKHLGATKQQDCTVLPTPVGCQQVANQGRIHLTSVAAAGGTITGITIGGISVIAGPIPVPLGATLSDVVSLIATAIGTSTGVCGGAPSPPPPLSTVTVPDYTACPAGQDVVISRVPAGALGAGDAIVFSANQTGTVSAIGRVTINLGPSNALQTMDTLTVNGQNLLCNAAPIALYTDNISVNATTGAIIASTGTNGSTERTTFKQAVIDRINACAVIPPGTIPPGATAPLGYTATSVSNDVRIIAPKWLGATANAYAVGRTGTGSVANFAAGATMNVIQSGVSVGDVTATTLAMSGGQDAFAGIRTVRVGVGAFSRTDIVPGITSYPKATARSDCLGVNCTYDEEMTNFANWYAYYRTRMQMMKTSVGRAFIPIDTNFRVGFITICPISGSCTSGGNTLGLNVDAAKYLKIDDFSAAQKNAWYTKLYSTQPLGSTPLREALSRVGAIYAGNLGTGLTVGLTPADLSATPIQQNDDPVTRSCQPNFALLSTDGYWNGGAGYRENGSTLIGNQDNVNNPITAPFSKQSDGVFDGGTPTASDTLADVALYYYKTDLRTSGPVSQNNVPVTNKDTASHQHMVTFTLGLGIDGELTYRPDYEQAAQLGVGDFFDIKQGVKKWPKPVADDPTALDDLWHAAVNGRGVFYSVKNPAELAVSLQDMRDQLEARLGAGASAATSSLTPVAGDNFAFTGSFTTVSWTGDLKARTIDLSTGSVSTAALWSGAAILDGTPYTSRQIFTYDPTDTTVGGGQNGNRMKHFCPPANVGGPGCTDGLGLTPSPGEMDFFATSQLPQVFDPALGQAVNATSTTLVNYLRGDRSFEATTPTRTLANDLYRQRDSLMGDVVNAQPLYVKRSPFSYSDAGYLVFKACTEGVGTGCPAAQFPAPFLPRLGTVYSAGNDGMLHAFETDKNNNPYYQITGISTPQASDDTFTGNNSGNGVERWAYIPALVVPNLYNLAKIPYAHTYFTDGTPQSGDICVSTPCTGLADWRTILVAGLNSGGKGYYALDVTNPAVPKALWEVSHGPCLTVDANGVPTGPGAGPYLSDCNFGLSFGNAIITKRFFDQRWVVIVTSGYNNTFGTPPNQGDGKGYLYVLDAVTGNILHRLTTGVGTPDVNALVVPPHKGPSGLGKINAWTTNGAVDNTSLAVYGGDLEGNLWRFKLDVAAGSPPTVTRVATVKDAAGVPQPITSKPELADVNGERVIVFGTGKFLEIADKTPPQTATIPPTDLPFQVQTIYALRDNLSITNAGPVFSTDLRLDPSVKEMTLVPIAGTDDRTSQPPPAGALPNLAVDTGWRLDLPENGERINVDPVLQLGTLVIASNVPTTDTCDAGGFAFNNFLDVSTGSFVPGSSNNMASKKIAGSVLVGVNVIMLPGGAVKTIDTLGNESRLSLDTPVPPVQFVGKRVSWRELFIE